jgi:transposase-like protein
MSEKRKRKWERRSAAFKQMAVARMKQGGIRGLAKELGVPVSGLYRWKQLAERRQESGGEAAEDPRDRRVQELEEQVKELQGVIGQKSLELDFFAGALRRIRGTRPPTGNEGGKPSTRKSVGGWKRKAD